MNKEEIILEMQPYIKKVAEKYNDGKSDEDLEQEGMVAVIKAVNRSEEEGLSKERSMARAYCWARNAIIDVLKKKQFEYCDMDVEYVPEKDIDTFVLLLYEVKKHLTSTEQEFLDKYMDGFTKQEIMNDLNIEKTTYYNILNKIKKLVVEITDD